MHASNILRFSFCWKNPERGQLGFFYVVGNIFYSSFKMWSPFYTTEHSCDSMWLKTKLKHSGLSKSPHIKSIPAHFREMGDILSNRCPLHTYVSRECVLPHFKLDYFTGVSCIGPSNWYLHTFQNILSKIKFIPSKLLKVRSPQSQLEKSEKSFF